MSAAHRQAIEVSGEKSEGQSVRADTMLLASARAAGGDRGSEAEVASALYRRLLYSSVAILLIGRGQRDHECGNDLPVHMPLMTRSCSDQSPDPVMDALDSGKVLAHNRAVFF